MVKSQDDKTILQIIEGIVKSVNNINSNGLYALCVIFIGIAIIIAVYNLKDNFYLLCLIVALILLLLAMVKLRYGKKKKNRKPKRKYKKD